MTRELWIAQLAEQLTQRQQKVATAESCTGGGVAQALTEQPGSSAWFECGWVTYSNAAKTHCLGVEPSLLEREGAVSESVVKAMVAGACRAAGTDWALATSGVAGPAGGTPEKPVGLVWLAWGSADQQHALSCQLSGSRHAIREASIDRLLAIFVAELEAEAAKGL
ncbi:CinA family protein [Marinospirillum sp.]|uniref:CinA family protein n=1 Tax=Marinospirillum sp. TaxID=2183934 RepID=UPI003A8806DA